MIAKNAYNNTTTVRSLIRHDPYSYVVSHLVAGQQVEGSKVQTEQEEGQTEVAQEEGNKEWTGQVVQEEGSREWTGLVPADRQVGGSKGQIVVVVECVPLPLLASDRDRDHDHDHDRDGVLVGGDGGGDDGAGHHAQNQHVLQPPQLDGVSGGLYPIKMNSQTNSMV